MIRFAQEKDLHEIGDIYNDEILHGNATFDLTIKDDKDYLQWFYDHQDNHFILVDEQDGHLRGYASLSTFNSKSAYDTTCELSIYVHKQYRQQKVASKLMEEVLKIAKKRHVHTIISLITENNEASIRLHQKFGFTYCGKMADVGFKFHQYWGVEIFQIILM
ncbi:MAG: GNAT family N-acetyltransferase [Traorella sp.]